MKLNLYRRVLAVCLVLTMLALTGCSLGGGKPDTQNVDDGIVSGIRTGILRQGLSGQYECTDERVYFLNNITGVTLLYSGAYDSDELRPLCGVKGCKHDGPGCEAYFGSSGCVCCYDGKLYVNAGTALYRLNPDGTQREKILDVTTAVDGDYDGIAEAKLWNGVFTFYLTKFESNLAPEAEITVYNLELTGYDPYYYRLDGSMKQPKPMENLVAQYNAGETFLMRGGAEAYMTGRAEEQENGRYTLYTWNPKNNQTKELVDATAIIEPYYTPTVKTQGDPWPNNWNRYSARRYDAFSEGYWGDTCALYLERERDNMSRVVNNVLCRFNYADGTTETLLDTGLAGAYRLECYPDFFVLIQTVAWPAGQIGQFAPGPVLYFYNWDFERIGECDLSQIYKSEDDYLRIFPGEVICGESAGRIYLATRVTGMPEYYIDKSDFGTGKIKLHELRYAGIDLDKSAEAILATEPMP